MKGRKRHHAMSCCVVLTVLVILGILSIVLYILYRPLPPRVVTSPVETIVQDFSLLPPSLTLSASVHVMASNPSRAPFRYGETVTAVTYHGEPVGTTVVPAGKIGRRTTTWVAPVTVVDGIKVAESPHFASDVVAGALPFVVVVRLDGKALVLRAFEVSVTVEVVCYVQVYVLQGDSSSNCVSRVRTGPGRNY
ncbi:hypothetical protein CFC21_016531 [Triticum aestivum]|uniref:Late embryogenesis abundant protein LEA-2 subgroup domain-containing protein n=4 Tax=Triticum TaxID=4564 RepID=A0A9R1R5W4_TRITD|nr:uncharacterized protein LOC119359300 [Triticum dicoccoides]XP_044453092.1 uncharacterized protein LOC123185178 [Triticum aestivum]XP_048560796.1 uncharacterized protein LOC125541421 [Triticum urartu]XP_048560799.1 uncharacterized protein LOC125541423 [Triticum urartu]VAH29440.1 unnamed protein product [Triticum turgidum subsp. durum]EMS47199.1 hypothetical protein TRIUR3_20290 [Triticum urartu]KAF7000675.1 hypothetical protein CFC21_016531 [Triticum aestivum]